VIGVYAKWILLARWIIAFRRTTVLATFAEFMANWVSCTYTFSVDKLPIPDYQLRCLKAEHNFSGAPMNDW
jgi:hypothetical protein